MSFLLEKEFFTIEIIQRPQQQSEWIFQNIKQLLFEWCITYDTQHKLESITTQFFSKKFKNIHFMVYLIYENNPSSLTINFFILKNNVPITVQSNAHRIRLYSYLLRINSQISLGKFCICPKSGLIKFNAQMLISQFCLMRYKNPNSTIQEKNHQILDKLQCISVIIQTYLQKILHLINSPSIILQKQSIHEKTHKNQQTTKYQQQIRQLLLILPYIHQDLNFLIKSEFKVKQMEKKQLDKSILKAIYHFDKSLIKQYAMSQKIDFLDTDRIKEFLWLQKINDQKTENCEKLEKNQLVLDKITIKKVRTISERDYCRLDLFSGVRFSRTNQNRSKLYIQFVKKTGVTPKGEKLIARQKNCIDLYLKEGGKDAIAEYLDVSIFLRPEEDQPIQRQMKIQPLDPNSLFLVPYPTNFTNFLLSKRRFLSLSTKILLLLKIDKALSYFHGKGFQHLDLKPDNILLDAKQNIKLIDFAQSIHQKLPLSSKPGVSIPYSPPQFFSKYKFQPYRCDSYSFGGIIFQTVFQDLPQTLPSKKQKILDFYQNSSTLKTLYTYQPQKSQHEVQKTISNLLMLLCMKCMNPNPQLRPSHNWIRIYLKKCIQILSYY